MKKFTFIAAGLFSAMGLLAENRVVLAGQPLGEGRSVTSTVAGEPTGSAGDEVVYSTSFEDKESADKMVILDLNEDSADKKNGKWSRTFNSFFAMFSRTGKYSMVYFYSKKHPGNDWFFLEPITLKAGYYSLKFWYSADHKESLSVYWGDQPKPEAMTHELVKYKDFIEAKYVESANVVHIEKDGVYYFGFKAESEPDQNIICIDDVTLSKLSDTSDDLSVKLLSSSNGYLREQMSQDLAFSVENHGIQKLDGSKVTVKLDDKTLLEETIDVKAQETRKFTLEKALEGLAAGEHRLQLNVSNEADRNLDNNVLDYSFQAVKEPKVMYDFEDGKVPEGFLLKKEDQGTVNEGLADLFPNNEAWNTVKIVKNPYFGEWMLASASWLQSGAGVDRWCILPKVHVGSENAHLLWTANSADTNLKFAESYEVLVSVTDTELSSFAKVAEVQQENFLTDPATRGVDLSAYAGKDIYVAFRQVTPDGYFMALDNIAFYGDVAGSCTGIDEAVAGGVDLFLRGSELVCQSDHVESIELFDAGGRMVKAGYQRSSLDIAALPKGVYVARVSVGGKTVQYKFAK